MLDKLSGRYVSASRWCCCSSYLLAIRLRLCGAGTPSEPRSPQAARVPPAHHFPAKQVKIRIERQGGNQDTSSTVGEGGREGQDRRVLSRRIHG